jgi:flap endonuclease-1
MGVSYIKAPGEAESYAAELCRMNFVDGVISEDMDTLVYGCPLLIRNCIDKSIKRNNIVTIFKYDQIIKDLKMNKDEFIDLCILCGCDYSPSIPKVGSITSLKIIKEYKSIDEYIKSDNNLATEEFKNKYLLARQLFNQYYNNINITDIPIVNSEFNSDKLYNYLVNDCSINKNKIINSLKKLN